MAYYGQNGYGDDGIDIEPSGPKVTVREVGFLCAVASYG